MAVVFPQELSNVMSLMMSSHGHAWILENIIAFVHYYGNWGNNIIYCYWSWYIPEVGPACCKASDVAGCTAGAGIWSTKASICVPILILQIEIRFLAHTVEYRLIASLHSSSRQIVATYLRSITEQFGCGTLSRSGIIFFQGDHSSFV